MKARVHITLKSGVLDPQGKAIGHALAALGFAGYVVTVMGQSGVVPRIALALVATGALTMIVASGMRRSNRTNTVIVLVTLVALLTFVFIGMPAAADGARVHLDTIFDLEGEGIRGLLHATALMFVAYTGYGRIATLGEEIRDPVRSIPKAIVTTLGVTMVLYVAVAVVAVAAVGAEGVAAVTRAAAAPLDVIARGFGGAAVAGLVAAGAVTAMLGVLLNLLLGLSRVLLAMSRRGDMPRGLARLGGREASPRRAVVVVGILVASLVLTGSVQLTWSFSAFTVLVYYALTNLAALRLPAESRLYPRWVPVCGLASCLGLAFWVEPSIWTSGLLLIGAGFVWHRVARRRPWHNTQRTT